MRKTRILPRVECSERNSTDAASLRREKTGNCRLIFPRRKGRIFTSAAVTALADYSCKGVKNEKVYIKLRIYSRSPLFVLRKARSADNFLFVFCARSRIQRQYGQNGRRFGSVLQDARRRSYAHYFADQRGDLFRVFDKLLGEGDVLHVAFGSGMSGSVFNAIAAAKRAGAAHPDRRIEVIDSTCSSGGYGMLVDYAADMRDEGKTMDETIDWLNDNRGRIHHLFFSTVLSFFRRSGRVKATAAFSGRSSESAR